MIYLSSEKRDGTSGYSISEERRIEVPKEAKYSEKLMGGLDIQKRGQV